MKSIQNWKPLSKAEILFKIWFYLYVILSTCNLTYGKEIISFCMWPMLFLGAGLVLYRLVHYKEYIRMPQLWVLLLMFGSYLFSMVMNLQYESKKGLVTMVFWVLYFGILYAFRNGDSQERVRKEFEIMAGVHILYALVMTLISLGMMVVGYSSSYIDKNNGNYEVCSGFRGGRLWGAFQDPNLGAIVCCTAIVLCIYYIWRRKEKIWKVLLAVCIVLFLLYIAFSDSRNGLISISLGMASYAFFQGFYREKRLRKQWINLLAAILIGALCFLLPEGIKYSYNQMAQKQTQENSSQKSTLKQKNVQVKRNYSMKGDISNRRFDIWKSAVEVGMSRPVTGTSFPGIVPYAKENLPETYIVNNDHWDYSTMDNEVLNVFVSQGFPGLLSLILFVACSVKYVFSRIWKLEKTEFQRAAALLTCIVMLSVSAMFQATMFYQNSTDANMFWMFLGYLIFMLGKISVNKGKKEQVER